MLPPLVNGKFQKPQELMLEPMQLAALLVLDGVAMAVQTGANQLGGFLKLEREAQILCKVLALLVDEKKQLVDDWGRKVKLVDASAVAKVAGP